MINNMNNFDDFEKNINEALKKMESNENLDYYSILENLGINYKEIDESILNEKRKLRLGFVKLHPDAVVPSYNYESDSGFDLYSVEEIIIPALGRALVPTGLSFDINDGYEIQVRSKSGLAINQGIMCLNSPGTVDNGYTGEVKVILFNTNQIPITITKGMKVAQAVLTSVVNGGWVQLTHLENNKDKDRGDNGFGSTGI